MTSTVIITLPLPPRQLSPNARVHWRTKARYTKKYRHTARQLTMIAGGRGQRWTRASAQATFYWPDPQRRDIRNAEQCPSPAYNGIVDAGLIVDDNSVVLTHAETQFRVDRQHPRVEIIVEKLG